MCRVNMDMSNRVSSFEKFGLLDPTNFEASILRVAQILQNIGWATDIYPYYMDLEGKLTVP